MALNLLQIVQNVRGRLGQPIPATVAASTDPGIIQCMGILNEFLEDLVVRKYWSANSIRTTFAGAVAEDQGSLDTLFPFGFEGIVPDTFYSLNQILPVRGSLSASEWAARKAMNMTGPLPAFRIQNNRLLMNPVPATGQSYAVEYFSSFFVFNNDEPLLPVYRKYWKLDTDVCTVDDSLAMAYLKWAWRAAKGQDYAEDFRKYEIMVKTKGIRDATPEAISMSGHCPSIGPGILVAPGSWPL